jgi:hypothetical protein
MFLTDFRFRSNSRPPLSVPVKTAGQKGNRRNRSVINPLDMLFNKSKHENYYLINESNITNDILNVLISSMEGVYSKNF